MTTLHANPDDWTLHANGDTERDSGRTFIFPAYLTDPQGNRLIDPQGNYLIGNYGVLMYPQKLKALPDDFNLHAE